MAGQLCEVVSVHRGVNSSRSRCHRRDSPLHKMPIVVRRFVVARVSNSNYAANGAASLLQEGRSSKLGLGRALLRNFAFPFAARASCVSANPRDLHTVAGQIYGSKVTKVVYYAREIIEILLVRKRNGEFLSNFEEFG